MAYAEHRKIYKTHYYPVQSVISGDDPPNAEIHLMRAFYLRIGIGNALYEGVPQIGLVQTPDGVDSIIFNINDVDAEMGSTVFFQAGVEGKITVSTLKGAEHVT